MGILWLSLWLLQSSASKHIKGETIDIVTKHLYIYGWNPAAIIWGKKQTMLRAWRFKNQKHVVAAWVLTLSKSRLVKSGSRVYSLRYFETSSFNVPL